MLSFDPNKPLSNPDGGCSGRPSLGWSCRSTGPRGAEDDIGKVSQPDREEAQHHRQGDVAQRLGPLAGPQEVERLQAEGGEGGVAAAHAHDEERTRFRSRQPRSRQSCPRGTHSRTRRKPGCCTSSALRRRWRCRAQSRNRSCQTAFAAENTRSPKEATPQYLTSVFSKILGLKQ